MLAFAVALRPTEEDDGRLLTYAVSFGSFLSSPKSTDKAD
jgi:hypothetical protein